MPTNYLLVNGMKIAQIKDGVRTDYLTDALGSVTATKNQSQQIVNTYRYKPYGGLLSRTGSGDDPRYLWIGTRERRFHGMRSSAVGQIYSMLLTNLGFRTNSTTYSLTAIPPKLSCTKPKRNNPTFYACGESKYTIWWNVVGKDDFDGAVIQHVLMYYNYKKCEGSAHKHKLCNANTIIVAGGFAEQYWEAWPFKLKAGKVEWGASGYTDWFTQENQGDCTKGISTIRSHAAIVNDLEYRSYGFSVGGAGECPGFLPASLKEPPGFRTVPNKLSRTFTTLHECCCDGKKFLQCRPGAASGTSASVLDTCKPI